MNAENDAAWSCCGHAGYYHGPEVPGCAECRCRNIRPLSRPKLLDLFSGQGGAAAGYIAAGRRMSNLRALVLLPFAALADTLTAIADHIDTKLADAINTEADNT